MEWCSLDGTFAVLNIGVCLYVSVYVEIVLIEERLSQKSILNPGRYRKYFEMNIY